MTAVVVFAGILITLAVVLWFFSTRQVPEEAAGHGPATSANWDPRDLSGSRRPLDRPAGPDAESMSPDDLRPPEQQ